MEIHYKEYQHTNSLGERINVFPITDGQIDFSQTHNKCRDLPLCIIFALAILMGLAIFIFSVVVGKPGLLYSPTDSFNGICGYDFQGVNNVERPYLMSGIGVEGDMSICVSTCPTTVNNCVCRREHAPFPAVDNETCLVDETCSFYSGEEDTVPLMNYCVSQSNQVLANHFGSQVLRDIISRIWVCAIALGITAGLCIIYITLLIFFSYCIVWGSIIISLIGIFLLTIAILVLSCVLFYRDSLSTAIPLLLLGIVFLIVFFILLPVVVSLRRRITLSIGIIREACNGIRAVPTLCCVPAVFTVLAGACYAMYCIALILFIGSFHVTVADGDRSIEVTGFSKLVLVVQFLIFLWLSFVCIELGESVIAGALAAWYFSRDRHRLSNTTPVAGAFYRSIRYSFGTVCAGAGVLTVLELLLLLAKCLPCCCNNSSLGDEEDASTRRRSSSSSSRHGGGCQCDCEDGGDCQCGDCAKACGPCMICVVFVCCVCCVGKLVERFLVFINKRAYVVAAVTGNSFIESCLDSFRLLLRNIGVTMAIENVKTLPVTIGNMFIFIVSALVVLIICNPYVFSTSTRKTGGYVVEYWYIVYILCLFLIFFVLLQTTTIITFSIDSIFIFYLIDLEYSLPFIHSGVGEPPFAPADLVDHMKGAVAAKGQEMALRYHLDFSVDSPSAPSAAGRQSQALYTPSSYPPQEYGIPMQYHSGAGIDGRVNDGGVQIPPIFTDAGYVQPAYTQAPYTQTPYTQAQYTYPNPVGGSNAPTDFNGYGSTLSKTNEGY